MPAPPLAPQCPGSAAAPAPRRSGLATLVCTLLANCNWFHWVQFHPPTPPFVTLLLHFLVCSTLSVYLSQNGNHVELAMEWLFANPEAAAAAEAGGASATQQQQDDEQLAQVGRAGGEGWCGDADMDIGYGCWGVGARVV